MFTLPGLTLEDVAPHLYDPQYYTVNMDPLVDKMNELVAAINELGEEVTTLRARVLELENRPTICAPSVQIPSVTKNHPSITITSTSELGNETND